MKKIELKFGCLADDLKTQLDNQNIKYTNQIIKKYEKIKFAINMLYVHSYLTDNQKDKCFKKMIKELSEELIEV